LAAFSGTASGAVINEMNGRTYETIQTALDDCSPGDTILVEAGEYTENVQINQENVSLKAIRKGDVVIRPGDINRPVINVTGAGASIRGFNLTGGNDYGIVVNADRCTISHTYITAPGGIKLNGSSNSTIIYNTIENGGDGICLINSSGNLISANIINLRYNGIYLQNSSYNTISQNRFEDNTYSIAMNGASFNSILDNNMTDNNFGIYNYGVNNTITANRIANSTCYNIYLQGSDNSIYGNYLINGLFYTVEGNRLNNTEIGNYWSAYSGDDTNGDGLGDSPNYADNRPLIVDLAVTNAVVTPTSIQVTIRNNGRANLTRIEPTARFLVKISCDGNETEHYINPLNAGETQTVMRSVSLGAGNHVVNVTIPYNATTHLLENKDVRDANIANNNLSLERNLIPPTITYSNLTATPLKGIEPLNVTVMVDITNTGDFSKNETVILTLNGTVFDHKIVEVDGGSKVTVTFTLLLSNGVWIVGIGNTTTPVTINVTRQLKLTTIDPANGTLSVASTKKIVITFSENIAAGSAYNNITVRTSLGVIKAISKSISGNKLFIAPTGGWSPGVMYKVYLPANSVRSIAGAPLSHSFESSFTSAIVVRYVDPRNGATWVSRTRKIVITFSNNILAGPYYGRITVRTSTGRLASIRKSISGNRLYITPVGSWGARRKYIVTVPKKAVRTGTGNMMAADFRSTFTTR